MAITEKESIHLRVLIERTSQAAVDLYAARQKYDALAAELNDYIRSTLTREEA